MKTFKNWMEGTQNFTDYVQPGDEVDEAMVDYFRDLLPPRSMQSGYLQVGEPYSHIVDTDGKWKATYSTFAMEDGHWIYKGCCIAGGTEDRRESGDPWRKRVAI